MDWKNKFRAIDNKIRNQLFERKTENFLWINRCVDEFDPQGVGKLTPSYINLFLNKAGIFLTTQELRTIRDHFDYDQSGQISYVDMINTLKDNISDRAIKAIKQAWSYLDQEETGYVTLDRIFSIHKPSDHPHTETRKKFSSEVQSQFAESIVVKSTDGKGLTEKQFFDYYTELGVCIPVERQDYFVNLILSTWNLKEGKYHVTDKRLRELELILYEKIRQRQTNELNAARAAFKYFDLADSGSCNLQHFTQALDKFGCKFAEHEIWTIFTKYDTSSDGLLSYKQFCEMLISIENPPSINPLTTLGQNSIGFKQLKI